MSGGSGALLNAHTWHAIHQQQVHHHESACGGAPPSPLAEWLEHDLDIDHGLYDPCCLCDLEWDQPDCSPFQEPQPRTAASQAPVGSIVNTRLFPFDGLHLLAQHEQECCTVLEQTFCMPSQGLINDLPQLIHTVATQSNYLVCDITRLENTAQRQMHEQFKNSYAITNTRQVYHGTGQAPLIARVGFRGAASERAKYGKGIYTSNCVYHALAYAELTPEDKLTVLVVQLHVGATGLGKQDQVDFGHNARGERILTLTNLEGDIYCASHESQLLATYMITVRFMFENPHTPAHQARVGIYNHAIAARLKRQVILANPLAALATAAHAARIAAGPPPPAVYVDTPHKKYSVDTPVRVIQAFSRKYSGHVGSHGVIRRIVAKNSSPAGTGHICFLELQHEDAAQTVQLHKEIAYLNGKAFLDFLGPSERHLLPCRPTHIQLDVRA